MEDTEVSFSSFHGFLSLSRSCLEIGLNLQAMVLDTAWATVVLAMVVMVAMADTEAMVSVTGSDMAVLATVDTVSKKCE